MKFEKTTIRACFILVSITLLMGLNSCGVTQSNSIEVTNESVSSSIVNIAEEPLSVAHPFIYSDATWETKPSEIDSVMGKDVAKISFVGGGKKAYAFDEVECNTLIGKCSFVYKDDFLCKSTYTYDSAQPFSDISSEFVSNLKEVYSEPSSDKSQISKDGSGVWLEWVTDDVKISYFYLLNKNNQYQIILSYEVPENEIPETDASNRDGDFRVGFWGDDVETINKYESSDFQMYSEEDNTLLYQGTVAGHNAYIFYIFDEDGKLYKGAYQLTDSYNEGSMYISVFNTLKESLTEKYGTPTSDKKNKFTSLANYTDEGTALQLGYVVYGTEWKTATSKISLGMLGVNYEVNILIDYIDPTHKEVKNTSGL